LWEHAREELGTSDWAVLASATGQKMIQRNTAVSETVLRVMDPKPGYEFHLLNECNAPEAIRYFENPDMACIVLSEMFTETK